MYEVNYTVRLSEAGVNKTMTVPAVVNYFQDTSMAHSEYVGLGFDYLNVYKRTWVLSAWQIVFDRFARIGEEVSVKTWATQFKGLMAQRNFTMCDKDDNIIAWANSMWVFMDIENKRPAKPSLEDMDRYQPQPPLDREFAPRNIEASDASVEEAKEVEVKIMDIDTNGHVNNCKYIEIALNTISLTQCRQIRVEYKRSAVLGDVMCPKIQKEDDRIVITLDNREGCVFAIVEVTL